MCLLVAIMLLIKGGHFPWLSSTLLKILLVCTEDVISVKRLVPSFGLSVFLLIIGMLHFLFLHTNFHGKNLNFLHQFCLSGHHHLFFSLCQQPNKHHTHTHIYICSSEISYLGMHIFISFPYKTPTNPPS